MFAKLVRDMLRPGSLVTASPSDSVRLAARAMAENHCGSVLVMEEERVLGIFTERDLLIRVAAAGRDLDATLVDDVMTRDPDIIAADRPVAEAIRMMDEFSYRYLPAVEDGRVVGVVSTRHLPFADVLEMQSELDLRHRLAECLR